MNRTDAHERRKPRGAGPSIRAAVAVLVAVLTAAGAGRVGAAPLGPIKIGVIVPLTGRDSEGAYTGMQFVIRGLAAVGGRADRQDAFVSAMRAVALPEAPRGPVRLDAWGNPIENVYIRRVDIVDGQPQNTVVYTYPNVSQFWTFAPEAYLKAPVYSRDNPPAHP